MIVQMTVDFETEQDENAVFRIGRREGPRMLNFWSTSLTVDEAIDLRTELDAALRKIGR